MTTPFPFVSGAVLTAAQLNAITEVPVSAKTASYTLAATDAGSRITMNSASATTITVNTGLFTAGQSLRIQNLNGGGVCTVTAGTATVTSAGPLAIPSWGGGQLYFTSASAAVWFPDAAGSGLTLVSATTIGTTVASVTVSSAFSSTYDSYKIIVSGGVGSTASGCTLQLGSTTTGYYLAYPYVVYSTGSISGFGYANSTPWNVGVMTTTTGIFGAVELVNPNLAKPTQMTSPAGGTSGNGGVYSGYLDNTTQYTAFTLAVGAGTLTGGTIRVYGYQNS